MKLNFEAIINSLNAKAHSISYDNDRLNNLINESKKRLKDNKAFSDLIDDLRLSLDLIRQYIKGEYRLLSKGTLILIIIGFLYLVHPFDIIPDFLIGGFVDDAAVFAYILKMIKHEIEEFKEWKEKRDIEDGDLIDLDDEDIIDMEED